MKKQQQYSTLQQLLDQDPEARGFFQTLPDYVQQSAVERSGGINSYESLCHFVDRYTNGE